MNSPSDYDKQIEPIRSLLPYGNKISAHIQCKIKMDGLLEQSKIAYKFNVIQEPVMSISILCDNGCTVTFIKQTVQVNKGGGRELKGYREPANKLWRFPQDETKPQVLPLVTQLINAILPEGKISNTLNFLHRSTGCPTKTTLLNAIRRRIFQRGLSSQKATFTSFCQTQYPQRWGIKIEQGRTLNQLNNRHTKTRKTGTSKSAHTSTGQRDPQGRYTPTIPDDFPYNREAVTKILWSYMHMTQMLFLYNHFQIDPRYQSCRRIK